MLKTSTLDDGWGQRADIRATTLPRVQNDDDHAPWRSPGGEFTVPETNDEYAEEEEEEAAPPRRSSRKAWAIATVVSLVAMLCAGGVLYRNWYVATKSAEEQAKTDRWFAENSSVASWPAARAVLKAHAEALVAGDEKGWMAAVDPGQPKLVGYYTYLFRTMRALGVTQWTYWTYLDPIQQFGQSRIQANLKVMYCLSATPCPQRDPMDDALSRHLAIIEQTVELEKIGDAYKIIGVTQGNFPAPWQAGDLALATGKRVVVMAPPALKGRLPEVVAAADRAAVEADRFAGHIGYKPSRYHVYLAGAKQWKTWHGGKRPPYSVAYATPVGLLGTDVVLDMSRLTREHLGETIQHEFGHVITVGATDRTADAIYPANLWLQEGIAEYIGHGPADAGTIRGLRTLGKPPSDLILPPLWPKSPSSEVGRLYGYGHLGVTCMAKKFGERKMLTFITLTLREKKDYDPAAKAAFGRPFAEVDKVCAGDVAIRGL